MAQTQEELKAEFDILTQEETQIPIAIDALMKEITPIEEQIASLKDQAQEIDLRISEQPPQVYNKQCNCAFLCIGKTCAEIPGANPEIANLINQRNPLIRQSNELQAQVNEKAKKVTVLGNRQIEVKTRLNEIRGQLISETQITLFQPFKLETITKYLPYVLIGGGALALIIIIIMKKKEASYGRSKKRS